MTNERCLEDPFPMQMLKIEKIEQENSMVKSFHFKHSLKSLPGQFVMVWYPGHGEKPMSIAKDTGDMFSLAIAAVGGMTKDIANAKVGDFVGVRGPLGTNFNLTGESIALVGGGYGAGPMASLAELAIKKGFDASKIHFIIGARNEDLLLFHDRLLKKGVNIHITTDDGSVGHQGIVTDALNEVVLQNKIDKIYTVGPEMMMKAVYDVAVREKIDIEISLERYTKCGIGVCGSCVVDPTGERMCMEGPVISKDKIEEITEFGKYHRDATGNKVVY
jgi:dihydroorotate dehydrogenase electron transfer subunit